MEKLANGETIPEADPTVRLTKLETEITQIKQKLNELIAKMNKL